jgi:hypothetical protein
MSLHIAYDYQCPVCGVNFIPYKEGGMVCPQCGAKTDEYFNFIDRAIASIKYHLEYYGKIHPGAWLVSSFADAILEDIFEILEIFKASPNITDFNSFAKTVLEQRIPEHEKYLRQHIFDMTVIIKGKLEKEGLY